MTAGELLYLESIKAIENKASRRRQQAIFKRYSSMCIDAGEDCVSFSYSNITRFVCMYVASNEGSTRSLSNVISMLKGSCRQLKQHWLSDDERKDLKDLVRELEYRDSRDIIRKRAIRMLDLMRMAKGWNIDRKADLQLATMYLMAYQGLLRSGELLSGLLVKHISWTGEGNNFDLELERTKTVRKGPSVSVTYQKSKDEQAMFAGDYLVKWFEMNKLWNKPEALLFPSNRMAKDGSQRTWSKQWFRSHVKQSVASIGLCSAHYSGHSFRAGELQNCLYVEFHIMLLRLLVDGSLMQLWFIIETRMTSIRL